MPSATSEKRKQQEDESSPGESPRKRPLYDAFKELSLQNPWIRRYESQVFRNIEKTHLSDRTIHDSALLDDIDESDQELPDRVAEEDVEDDTEMEDRASYSKDAHTVVVNSLDDDSDTESHEEEAQFMFKLPGTIDKTFAGSKAIPKSIYEKQQLQGREGQLVLYTGTPVEVIERSLLDHAKREALRESETPIIEELPDDTETLEDSMDLD
ncbi:protein of unknown function [Taphrina deformans PYCC 5710]|uniref:Uncharacterized protein n=1 Tax=Taphrina deformans (strain PYCC 5710 / ATCC 11124 / CBS 356.35 / IMI 108563 / JCM 9778 / NBRC 8474) TaxID=1097556 RepID=R4XDT1_TAPDE|nr:protein of unknown function [Taphrina deformans PYCC 5710]|eukprot:CCG83787.1 protein of unknown function [Taphrina deformans PYCC 5710]